MFSVDPRLFLFVFVFVLRSRRANLDYYFTYPFCAYDLRKYTATTIVTTPLLRVTL